MWQLWSRDSDTQSAGRITCFNPHGGYIRGNYFFIVVVIVFCLMTYPSASFSSEQVPAAHLSPVLAPLESSSLASRRDVGVAGTAGWEGLGNSCAPGSAPLQEQKILSLYSASSSSGRCFTWEGWANPADPWASIHGVSIRERKRLALHYWVVHSHQLMEV